MKLVIAEKPSMAGEIANALGVTSRANGFLSSSNYLVTWCVGHLVSLAEPETYDQSWKNWTFSNLPMVPAGFRYQINEGTKTQFNIIKRLTERDDVTSLVNAADAGREGELIFDLVIRMAGCKKPIERLWISSLTREDIRAGFANLKSADEFKGLRMAAHARQQSDWLVGLNATRAQTLAAQGAGHRGVWSCGRVQTPTLALIVGRDREIKNFKPETYYQVTAEFAAVGGTYVGLWTGKDLQTNEATTRLKSKEAARAICVRAQNQPGRVTNLEIKEVSEPSPQLFDLTALQRTANTRFGFTAAKTLELAQSLYEKKLLSYPRTSSRYLSTNLAAEAEEILAAITAVPYQAFAREILQKGATTLSKQFVDDQKVSDHHAIVPTKERNTDSKLREQLSSDELSIYDLVTRRFLAAFYPAAKIERTTVETTTAGEQFVSKGRVLIFAGWKTVETAEADGEEVSEKTDKSEDGTIDNQSLPKVSKSEVVQSGKCSALEKQTKAPPQFSEASLLGAMENAGRKLEDQSLKTAMLETGLGTPATRAGIIETLIRRNFVERKKKQLVATATGATLIESLSVELLKSPSLTAEWEKKFTQIERGEISYSDFIAEVKQMANQVVTEIKNGAVKSFAEIAAEEKDALHCPKCQTAGRGGVLILRTSKDGGKIMVCSVGREACGYLTDAPRNKAERAALEKAKCLICSGPVKLRLPKEKNRKAWFPCIKYPECKGSFKPTGGRPSGRTNNAQRVVKKGKD